jgi:surface polysaccharide O-acyltransferase-like enzyme
METAAVKKERFDNIDLLKFIAIFFVILYHFNSLHVNFLIDRSLSTYFNYFITTILGTCVPIFFFVNGALLLNKSELDLRKHVYKILKLVGLSLIWSIIILLLLMVIRNEKLSVHDLLLGSWMLKMGWNNYLWFLKALVVVYIFYPLIFNAWKMNPRFVHFFLLCVMVLTFGNTLIANCVLVFSFIFNLFLNKNPYVDYFSGFDAFAGIYGYTIGYFILGGLFFYNREYFKKKKFVYLSSLLIPLSMLLLFSYGLMASFRQKNIFDLTWNGYDMLFTLINVIALFILTMPYRHIRWWGKFVKVVGENSLGIYLIHFLVGSFAFPYFSKFSVSSMLVSDVIFSLIILCSSLGLVLLFKKIPVVKHLFII